MFAGNCLVLHDQVALAPAAPYLVGTALQLASVDWSQDPEDCTEWTRRNAYVESFAVHVRNLYEFLFATKSSKDRVTVRRHFVKTWSRSAPELLSRAFGQASEQVAGTRYGERTSD